MIQLAESLSFAAPHLEPTFVVAYIDPGTGSMIFQFALAALLTLGVAWRQLRARIGMLFARKAPETLEPGSAPTEPPVDR